jgi:hypothetical protein
MAGLMNEESHPAVNQVDVDLTQFSGNLMVGEPTIWLPNYAGTRIGIVIPTPMIYIGHVIALESE